MRVRSCLTLCDPLDCSPPGSSVHGNSPSKNTGVGCYSLLQGIFPDPGIELRRPALQANSLLFEWAGKPYLQGLVEEKLVEINFLSFWT